MGKVWMRGGLAVLLLAVFAGVAQASTDIKRNVERALRAEGQGGVVTSVEPTPMAGLFEIELNGKQRYYASSDGSFLIAGELFKVSEQGVKNLTEEGEAARRAQQLAKLDLSQSVTFPAANQKAEVLVFTDPTCGYCQKMHREIEQINALGITVHYMAFPRAGANSPSGKLMGQVWCADDSQAAMTESKTRGRLATAPAPCSNPVARQLELGHQLGVNGTPAVFSLDGQQLGGYLPAEQLARRLGVTR